MNWELSLPGTTTLFIKNIVKTPEYDFLYVYKAHFHGDNLPSLDGIQDQQIFLILQMQQGIMTNIISITIMCVAHNE